MANNELLKQANEIFRRRFGKNLPGYMPADYNERVRIGMGSRADSIRAGLLPRATAESAALQRVEAGQGTRPDSVRLGLVARPRAATAKEEALSRLNIPQARKDSLLAGVPRIKPDKPSEKKQAVQSLVRQGLLAPAQADSVLAGIKAPKETKQPKPRSLIKAGAEFAKTTIDTKRQLNATIPLDVGKVVAIASSNLSPQEKEKQFKKLISGREKLIEPGTPAEKNLLKKLEAYGDSSAIVRRAQERFSPDNDFNELVDAIPKAREALSEYSSLRTAGQTREQAKATIQAKYGYDLETLRNILYAETGK